MTPEQVLALLALLADLKSTVDRLAADNARLAATNADLVAHIEADSSSLDGA